MLICAWLVRAMLIYAGRTYAGLIHARPVRATYPRTAEDRRLSRAPGPTVTEGFAPESSGAGILRRCLS